MPIFAKNNNLQNKIGYSESYKKNITDKACGVIKH